MPNEISLLLSFYAWIGACSTLAMMATSDRPGAKEIALYIFFFGALWPVSVLTKIFINLYNR